VDLDSECVDLNSAIAESNFKFNEKNLALLPGESALGNPIHYGCLTLPNAFHVFLPTTPSTTSRRLC
jgi:hypothetical protein